VLPGANLRDAAGASCPAEGTYCVATAFPHDRVNFDSVASAPWFGVPDFHAPDFKTSAVLLVLPAVIALIAENIGHVKAVGEMTGADVDPYVGRAVAADGVGTMVASAVGGSPTTTYAENIGVMAATKVYSTAAYWVAGTFAILLGFLPKVGAVVNTIPPGVLGGVTTALYGLIGVIGVKIWIDNRVDFSRPTNQFTAATALVVGVADFTFTSGDLSFNGIALGTVAAIVVFHLMSAVERLRA
jgi:xanthine/uracil permease